MALRWFCNRSLLRGEGLAKELIDRIPGKQTDRRTPLGELNWIFTAITDTIAWNMLPRALFQKLFRQASPVTIGMQLGWQYSCTCSLAAWEARIAGQASRSCCALLVSFITVRVHLMRLLLVEAP